VEAQEEGRGHWGRVGRGWLGRWRDDREEEDRQSQRRLRWGRVVGGEARRFVDQKQVLQVGGGLKLERRLWPGGEAEARSPRGRGGRRALGPESEGLQVGRSCRCRRALISRRALAGRVAGRTNAVRGTHQRVPLPLRRVGPVTGSDVCWLRPPAWPPKACCRRKLLQARGARVSGARVRGRPGRALPGGWQACVSHAPRAVVALGLSVHPDICWRCIPELRVGGVFT